MQTRLFWTAGAMHCLLACGAGPSAAEPAPEPTTRAMPGLTALPAASSAAAPASAAEVSVKLRGTLRHEPWSKSMESFRAGGSDYFVLDGAPAEHGLVFVRPTAAVPEAALLALVGKAVEVEGVIIPPTPFVPRPTDQYPVGPDGKPAVSHTGGGLAASAVRAVP